MQIMIKKKKNYIECYYMRRVKLNFQILISVIQNIIKNKHSKNEVLPKFNN